MNIFIQLGHKILYNFYQALKLNNNILKLIKYILRIIFFMNAITRLEMTKFN